MTQVFKHLSSCEAREEFPPSDFPPHVGRPELQHKSNTYKSCKQDHFGQDLLGTLTMS